MASPRSSLSQSPKRSALHERTESQANELPHSVTLRMVQDQDSDDETDIYSTTPYPTKPAHVLLPTSGLTGGIVVDREYAVSDHIREPTTSFPPRQERTTRDALADSHQYSVSELSSTIQDGNQSSLIWEDTLNSSTTSIPHTPSEHNVEDDENSSDAGSVALPTIARTIKAVTSDSSSTYTEPAASGDSDPLVSESSSPNVVPISSTSSPNIVPLNSSSPNIVPVGSSSPNVVRAKPSGSSLHSSNSGGTTRRYGYASWRPGPSADQPSSDPSGSSPDQAFSSSPPNPPLRSFQSASSLALPPAESYYYSRTRASSTRSTSSVADVQALVDSGVPIQYPIIQPPSSSGSWAETSPSLVIRHPARPMTDRSSGGWNPHLSTVPSEWSAERALSLQAPSLRDDQTDTSVAKPTPSQRRNSSRPSIRVVDEHAEDEQRDRLTNLRPPPLRNKPSGALSTRSSDSTLSTPTNSGRPTSSGSLVLHAIPTWARVYYMSGGRGLELSALSLVESGRKPTSNSRPVSRAPVEISRPRTRPRENPPEPRVIRFHPADPRSHWRPSSQMNEAAVDPTIESQIPRQWSPHLHHDVRATKVKRSMWKPPSVEEADEKFFCRRNIQVYSFCLGFVFPLGMQSIHFLHPFAIYLRCKTSD